MNGKKKKNKRGFDTVKTFRKIKNQISKEIAGMNFEELDKYLKATKPIFPRKPGEK